MKWRVQSNSSNCDDFLCPWRSFVDCKNFQVECIICLCTSWLDFYWQSSAIVALLVLTYLFNDVQAMWKSILMRECLATVIGTLMTVVTRALDVLTSCRLQADHLTRRGYRQFCSATNFRFVFINFYLFYLFRGWASYGLVLSAQSVSEHSCCTWQ